MLRQDASRARSRSARRPGPSDPMRHARTCYDHLAGVAGVQVCSALLERGWITPVTDTRGTHQPAYELTETGRTGLAALGVDLPASRGSRRFAYACPDWTEPHPHIAGALGAAILDALIAGGYASRQPGTRTVQIERPIAEWLG